MRFCGDIVQWNFRMVKCNKCGLGGSESKACCSQPDLCISRERWPTLISFNAMSISAECTKPASTSRCCWLPVSILSDHILIMTGIRARICAAFPRRSGVFLLGPFIMLWVRLLKRVVVDEWFLYSASISRHTLCNAIDGSSGRM